MAISDETKSGPVSALRYSSNRFPGFGQRAVSGYSAPSAASSPATAPSPISSKGSNPLWGVRANDGGDGEKNKPTKTPPSPLDQMQLEKGYQLHAALSSPIGQLGTGVVGAVPGIGQAISGITGIVKSGTGGWLASGQRKGYNAGRESGLTSDEANSTTNAGLGPDDFESAEGTGGLTKAGASGHINDGYRPGDVTSEPLSDGGVSNTNGAGDGGGGASFSDGSWSDGSDTGGYSDNWSSSKSDSWGGSSSDSSGGSSSSASSSRVICTHMMRIGLMDISLWRADMTFTAQYASPTMVRGYHFWAIPYVRLMRRDGLIGRLAVQVMEPIARNRAEELAYQLGKRNTPNYRGKLARLILEPLSWLIGCVVEQKDWRALYMDKG